MIVLLAELAWGDGELLEAATPDGLSWPLLTGAVLFADELERDLEICNAGLDAARERDSPAGYAAASYCRAWALYEQRAVRAALADAKAALDAAPDARRTHVRTAYGAIACCQIQRGELEPAEAELHDASPGAISWRSTAALAHLALGERAEARRLAGAELELARRFATTRVVIRDLRVLGLVEHGERGIKLLREAIRTGRAYPPRLCAGRSRSRAAVCQRALRGRRAAAHGARAQPPRRAVRTGIDSLTPSELRVAELAAKGLTTRQIAEALFVTPKTVEFHLRHIYQKLDVGTRAALAEVLGEDQPRG